eukprot:gene16396-25131_t
MSEKIFSDEKLEELLACKRYSVRVRGRPGVFGGELEGFELPKRYEVVGEDALGWGGYGCVCAAKDLNTGDIVAVKKVKDIFNDKQRQKATIRELALLQHFTKNVAKIFEDDDGGHDNIVKLMDVLIPLGNRDDSSLPLQERRARFDNVYFVLEKYDSSLKKLITERWKMTEHHRACLVYQLLRGLKTVHSAGCVHRDLKPENLLVKQDGNTYYLALCDMGSGRDVSTADSFLTNTNFVTSSCYVPPEALVSLPNEAASVQSSDKSLLTAIDVWSVGCILAELLAGSELFRDSRGPAHRLKKIATILGPPPPTFSAYCPGGKIPQWLPEASLSREAGECNPYLTKFCKSGSLIGTPSDAEVDILSKMLQWDPKDRCSVEEAISHE